MSDWQDPESVRFMLDDCETWAIVGLSGNPARTAYSIAALLQGHGKRIVPIHPDAPTVLDEKGYATLADVPFPVDVVDVFRRSEFAPAIATEAAVVGAKTLWLQLGVVNEEAMGIARASQLIAVENRCIKVEYARLRDSIEAARAA